MILTAGGWKAARTLAAAWAAVVTLAGTASAQVALAFPDEKDFFSPGGEMTVSVTIPTGSRITDPLLHHVREGDPLPKNAARGGIEFPELAGRQELTLRAPEEEGAWWLVLYDGKKLVARITFDVFDLGTVLELTRRRICTDLMNENRLIGDGCEQYFDASELTAAAQVAPAPEVEPSIPERAAAPSASSPRLRLLSSGAIRTGVRVEAGVNVTGQTQALELRWANTASLPFAAKKLAPFTGDAFPVSSPQSSTIVVAPARPGDYDLLLFGNGELLEALPVSVQ